MKAKPIARRSLQDAASDGELFRSAAVSEQMDQRALDRGLPRRSGDPGTEQVGDVEHVARALAEFATWAEAMLRLSFEIAVVS